MDAGMISTGFKMTMALGVVLLAFGASVMVFKMLQGRLGGTGLLGAAKKAVRGNPKPIEVVATQALGPGRSLILVECMGKRILLGSTPQSIHAVADLGDLMGDEDGFSSSLQEKMPADAARLAKRELKDSLNSVSRV